MIRRPWQIWLFFALCLAVVLPAMGWLTVKVLEIDRAQELARREAELESLVAQTLWNMDNELTPIVGQEAARPFFVYESFYNLDDDLGLAGSVHPPAPSPIIVQPNDYVMVHFQIELSGEPSNEAARITSPQTPPESQRELADIAGNTQTISETSCELVSQLSLACDPPELWAMLPEETLPRFDAQHSLASKAQPELEFQLSQNAYVPPKSQAAPYPQVPSEQGEADTPQAQQQAPLEEIAADNYARRSQAYQNYGQQIVGQQQLAAAEVVQTGNVTEGVAQTLWLDGKLLLARRVTIDGQELIQGCWFNWERIQETLLAQVAPGMPAIQLRPIDLANPPSPSRALVTLPVELVVPAPHLGSIGWSPLRIALAAAWLGMLLAAVAVGGLLLGVIRLSERRGEFVSAVTHELRTPLTTFRMYAEMLAEGMVPAEREKQYLETLRGEADRLSHLVENVLSYARLERGRKPEAYRETTCGELVHDMAGRLTARAEEAGFTLTVDVSEETAAARLTTDAAAVEQILFNLVDNACKYAQGGEKQSLELAAEATSRALEITLRDYGPGIKADDKRRLFRPFHKSCQEAAVTAPGVGLGLALSRRLAGQLGGKLDLDRQVQPGARFTLTLPRMPG